MQRCNTLFLLLLCHCWLVLCGGGTEHYHSVCRLLRLEKMYIVVVELRNGQSIRVDVDEKATVGDVRAAAGILAQRNLRALAFNGSVLPDSSPALPIVQELRPREWFLGRLSSTRDVPIRIMTPFLLRKRAGTPAST